MLCFNCGTEYIAGAHKCTWVRKGLGELRCKGIYKQTMQCNRNGLTCEHKEVDKTVKDKVKNQLRIELKGFIGSFM